MDLLVCLSLSRKVKMEEDEEDRVLFSSLGVTSANPEDIERNILGKVCLLFKIYCIKCRILELSIF